LGIVASATATAPAERGTPSGAAANLHRPSDGCDDTGELDLAGDDPRPDGIKHAGDDKAEEGAQLNGVATGDWGPAFKSRRSDQ
jgi:hypothetical protein